MANDSIILIHVFGEMIKLATEIESTPIAFCCRVQW